MTKPQTRVLIVEDDLVDRMACRRALAQDPDYEFMLSEAETGREGLQLAHAQKPDCVLLDYHLPDLLADFYHNTPCGYHSLNADGVFVQINDTALKWLGRAREEVVGKDELYRLAHAREWQNNASGAR